MWLSAGEAPLFRNWSAAAGTNTASLFGGAGHSQGRGGVQRLRCPLLKERLSAEPAVLKDSETATGKRESLPSWPLGAGLVTQVVPSPS